MLTEFAYILTESLSSVDPCLLAPLKNTYTDIDMHTSIRRTHMHTHMSLSLKSKQKASRREAEARSRDRIEGYSQCILSLTYTHTVSCYNFQSQNFKWSVSNHKQQICCLFVRTVSNFKLPGSRPQKPT